MGGEALYTAEWVESLPKAKREALTQACTPHLSRYVMQAPTPKQAVALLVPHRAILYGGAAGGGKSSLLLMAALQYADRPGAALIVRREGTNLTQPGGLIPRSHEWLANTDAHWRGDSKTWTFPSGFALKFGHMEHLNDMHNYQSGEYDTVCMEEATEFFPEQIQYLFSRQRRPVDSTRRLRTILATNPGGLAHDFLAEAFGLGEWEGAPGGIGKIGPEHLLFIPSLLTDNPHIDQQEYRESSLGALPEEERHKLEHGDWNARPRGDLVATDRIGFVSDTEVPQGLKMFRWTDLAATGERKKGRQPDFTASALGGYDAETETLYVLHGLLERHDPAGVDALLKSLHASDPVDVEWWFEQEPGSSGKLLVTQYQRMCAGRRVFGHAETGPKRSRWVGVRAAIEQGRVKVVRGTWVRPYLDHLAALTTDEAADEREGRKDDGMDALAGLYRKATGLMGPQWWGAITV